MPKVSVIIITKNESAHIDQALASVAWADERIVVDAESTDDTAARARRAGARVEIEPWPGYGQQKNFAASLASHDWIFSLDADERVSDPLAREIRGLLGDAPSRQGYRMPRVTWYMGQWIRSTDWYPDLQLRLYNRRSATWSTSKVHESVVLGEEAGLLSGELLHYAFRDLSHHLHTIDRYTTLAAEQMHEEGRRTGVWRLAVHPPAAFFRNAILRGGLRDGSVGLIVSAMNAYYVFLKFAKLWERQHRASS
ncbi:MAG: glycosyltransferase family 2 protein [Vicinamibacterales bacterium]